MEMFYQSAYKKGNLLFTHSQLLKLKKKFIKMNLSDQLLELFKKYFLNLNSL